MAETVSQERAGDRERGLAMAAVGLERSGTTEDVTVTPGSGVVNDHDATHSQEGASDEEQASNAPPPASPTPPPPLLPPRSSPPPTPSTATSQQPLHDADAATAASAAAADATLSSTKAVVGVADGIQVFPPPSPSSPSPSPHTAPPASSQHTPLGGAADAATDAYTQMSPIEAAMHRITREPWLATASPALSAAWSGNGSPRPLPAELARTASGVSVSVPRLAVGVLGGGLCEARTSERCLT